MCKYIIAKVKKVITKVKKMKYNAGSCLIVKFKTEQETDENLQNFAEDFFEVISFDYMDNGEEQLVGYMRQNCDEQQMLAAAHAWNIKLPEYKIECLSSENWLKESVIEFAPVDIAEFVVYGVHEKNFVVSDNKIGIKVYAATAFGSEHQTTKGCLQAISDINKSGKSIKKVLDVGTGSGILAIAAAKLWNKAQIIAVDIDDESVAVAEQNAVDNNVASQIISAYSDGYSANIVQQNTPYDVIFANILARPLIAMATDMAKSLSKGGYAVISGFIDDQVDWVVGEHEKNGLHLLKLYEYDNWRAALLQKE